MTDHVIARAYTSPTLVLIAMDWQEGGGGRRLAVRWRGLLRQR